MAKVASCSTEEQMKWGSFCPSPFSFFLKWTNSAAADRIAELLA
jgi:hypothetical protein